MMEKRKNVLFVVLCVIVVTLVLGLSLFFLLPKPQPLEISADGISLKVDETKLIEYQINKKANVVFEIFDKSIAEVSNFKISGKKVGETSLKITAVIGKETCEVVCKVSVSAKAGHNNNFDEGNSDSEDNKGNNEDPENNNGDGSGNNDIDNKDANEKPGYDNGDDDKVNSGDNNESDQPPTNPNDSQNGGEDKEPEDKTPVEPPKTDDDSKNQEDGKSDTNDSNDNEDGNKEENKGDAQGGNDDKDNPKDDESNSDPSDPLKDVDPQDPSEDQKIPTIQFTLKGSQNCEAVDKTLYITAGVKAIFKVTAEGDDEVVFELKSENSSISVARKLGAGTAWVINATGGGIIQVKVDGVVIGEIVVMIKD